MIRRETLIDTLIGTLLALTVVFLINGLIDSSTRLAAHLLEWPHN